MTHDERRARVVRLIAEKLALPNVFMGGPPPGALARAGDIYDAIRQSDAAAGLVLVPKVAMEGMLDAGSQAKAPDAQCSCTAAQRMFCEGVCRDALPNVWRAMLAAATGAADAE